VYADDTNLLVSGKNLGQLCDRAENLCFVANSWFSKNNLYLNSEKTSAILFRTKLNRMVVPESLNINGNQIELNIATKFLGVTIVEFLDCSENIERLGGKKHTLRTLYFANFENIMRHGIIFWASNSSAQSIFVIQKRTIRVIYYMSHLQSCRVFKANKILTTFALYSIFEVILLTYRNKHNVAKRTFDY